MFGYRGDETAADLERKRGYRASARARWPFLTPFDLSTIKNQVQLRTIVKDRTGGTPDACDRDVDAWMTGKVFETVADGEKPRS